MQSKSLTQSRMKLLITGPGGFLGSRLADYFEHECTEYEVIRAGRSRIDMLDEESADILLREVRPDVVLHCAGMADLKECEEKPQEAHILNVRSALRIAASCRKYGGKPILCSSDQVYFEKKSGKGMAAHRENEILRPFSYYGRLKLEMERECMEANPESVCLRLGWMYDWNIINRTEHGNFFRNICERIHTGKELSFPSGDYRGLTYVREAAQNMKQVFSLPGGVYNYGSDNGLDMYGLVKALLVRMGQETYPVVENTRAFQDEPRNIRMDGSLAETYGIYFSDTLAGLERCLGDSGYGAEK